MQDYQHWYPEEVTFQPKLHESAMSREFLRKSLGPEGAAMLAASGEERHMALVNRLYASYEKVRAAAVCMGAGGGWQEGEANMLQQQEHLGLLCVQEVAY